MIVLYGCVITQHYKMGRIGDFWLKTVFLLFGIIATIKKITTRTTVTKTTTTKTNTKKKTF